MAQCSVASVRVAFPIKCTSGECGIAPNRIQCLTDPTEGDSTRSFPIHFEKDYRRSTEAIDGPCGGFRHASRRFYLDQASPRCNTARTTMPGQSSSASNRANEMLTLSTLAWLTLYFGKSPPMNHSRSICQKAYSLALTFSYV